MLPQCDANSYSEGHLANPATRTFDEVDALAMGDHGLIFLYDRPIDVATIVPSQGPEMGGNVVRISGGPFPIRSVHPTRLSNRSQHDLWHPHDPDHAMTVTTYERLTLGPYQCRFGEIVVTGERMASDRMDCPVPRQDPVPEIQRIYCCRSGTDVPMKG